MTDDSPIPRRTLLSSLATVGTVGAVSGVGSAALFVDHENFMDNLLVGGELDLELCWEEHDDSEDCTPSSDPGPFPIDFGELEKGDTGSVSLRCALDDNPGWIWFRTSCPVDTCGLEDVLEVTMWYDEGCDGEIDSEQVLTNVMGTPIENLSLCEALKALNEGVLLDGDLSTDGSDPVQPDEGCCIGLKWEVTEQLCKEDTLDVSFEFYTEQWRHNTEPPANPFTPEDCIDCVDCPCGPAISWIAFCTKNGDVLEASDISMDVDAFETNDDGTVEPRVVQWSSDVAIDTVVIKYGNGWSPTGTGIENFYVDGASSGSVVPFQGDCYVTEDDVDQCNQCPCPGDCGDGVKFDWVKDDYDYDELRDGDTEEWESEDKADCDCSTGGKPR